MIVQWNIEICPNKVQKQTFSSIQQKGGYGSGKNANDRRNSTITYQEKQF